MAARSAVSGTMQLPQRALQRLDFALVINFLALGQLEGFQHFLHLIQRLLQLLDNAGDLLDGLADRRGFRRSGFGPAFGFGFARARRRLQRFLRPGWERLG